MEALHCVCLYRRDDVRRMCAGDASCCAMNSLVKPMLCRYCVYMKEGVCVVV